MSESKLDIIKGLIETEKPLEKKVKILWNSKAKQFSVKIPKRLANKVGINEGDSFYFTAKIPPHNSIEPMELVGRWTRDEK